MSKEDSMQDLVRELTELHADIYRELYDDQAELVNMMARAFDMTATLMAYSIDDLMARGVEIPGELAAALRLCEDMSDVKLEVHGE